MVGDIALDEVIAVPRLPAPGGKADGRLIGRFPGGMAANTAVAFARLGVTTRLIAAVGDDAEGAAVSTAVAGCGVDLSGVVRLPQTATFRCVIMIDDNGEKALVRLPSRAYLPQLSDIAPDAFSGAGHVHVTLGDATLADAVLTAAAEAGAATSLDIEAPDVQAAGQALGAVVGKAHMVFANGAAHARLGAVLGADALAAIPELVVTNGAHGADIRVGARWHSVAGHRAPVVDTTGAGDCFAAAYTAQRLWGEQAPLAGQFAAAAAALSLAAYGAQTAMPSRAAVERKMAERSAVGLAPARRSEA
ncbi:MAG: carbohydrate kinase family protein [Pseudomonadota bacterium]